METHLPDEDIVLTMLGGTASAEQSRIDAHLATCGRCAAVADSFRGLLGALNAPQPSDSVRSRLRDRLRQGARLRRFLDRLLTDSAWQAEVRRDPRSALEQYRIEPTPQLVAALLEIGQAPGEEEGQIDERVNKLWAGL